MTFCKKLLLIAVAVIALPAGAQDNVNKLQQFLSDPQLTNHPVQFQNEVKSFYFLNGYQFAWLTKQQEDLRLLSAYIRNADSLALRTADYDPELFKSYENGLLRLENENDSLLTEARITSAAIHLLHDMASGNEPVYQAYNGTAYTGQCRDLASLLGAALQQRRFAALINELLPADDASIAASNRYGRFIRQTAQPGYSDAVIISAKVNSGNAALIARLFQLGFISTDTIKPADSLLKQIVKAAQKLFSLPPNGLLTGNTVRAFNVPLRERIKELSATLNCLRWLQCIKESGDLVLVNIPSATLLAFEKGKLVLGSRVIVGKKSTPTPTLNSRITEVILYPYWLVPDKIAKTELLPAARRNAAYVTANNFEILQSNGTTVNAAGINWHAFNAGNFPYQFRQKPGFKNSLGIIKLNFYNPFSVYLHDTPGKSLFNSDRRYFSHGCMRLQKVSELAKWILKDDDIAVDTLKGNVIPLTRLPVTIKANKPVPVFVLYQTAWFDESGNIVFSENIYKKPGLAAKKKK